MNTDTPFFCHTSAQFIKNLVTKSQLTDLTQQIKHGKNVLLLVMHMEKNRKKKKRLGRKSGHLPQSLIFRESNPFYYNLFISE